MKMPMLVSDGYWTNVLKLNESESQTKKQSLQAEKRNMEMMIQDVKENDKFV